MSLSRDVTTAAILGSGTALVGKALPVNYEMDSTTGTVTVGTKGSLGTGTISNNMGTLNREGDPNDTTMPTCTWHQKDTSTLTLTAHQPVHVCRCTETESALLRVTALSRPP